MNSRLKKHTVNSSKSMSRGVTFSQDVEFKDFDLDPVIKTHMIREAFIMFDRDGSGEIDPKEFKKLVTSLGIEMDDKKILDLYRKIDTDGSGTIDLKEFTAMMMNFQFGKDSPIDMHLENTFTLYDKDGDGMIDKNDLMKASEELGEVMNLEDMELLIGIVKMLGESENKQNITSTDGEGYKITKEEFISALNKFGFLMEVKHEIMTENKTLELNNNNTARSSARTFNQNLSPPKERNSYFSSVRGSNSNLKNSRSVKSDQSQF